LTTRAEKRQSIQREEQRVSQYQEKLDQLNEHLESVKGHLATSRIYRRAGFLTIEESPATDVPRERLAALRSAFDEDPQQLLKGKTFSLSCKALQSFSSQVEKSTSSAWTKRFEEDAGQSLDTAFLRVFASSTGNSEMLEELDYISTEWDTFSMTPPKDEASLNRYEKLVAKRRRLASTIEFPDTVKTFLRAVNQGGAKLELLTAGVLAWLEENDVTDSFCIRARQLTRRHL